MRRHRLTAIAVTALVLAGAGCSLSKSKSSSAKDAADSFAGASASAAAGGDGSADGFGAGQNLQGGPAAATPSAAASSTGASAAPERTATGKAGSTPIVRGRVATSPEDIIKNAAISIEVKDVDKARNDAVGQAKGLGADLASEARAGTGEKKSATLVFRVPPTEFDNLVTAVGELGGEVTGSKTTTEDVTGQVADIKGRLGAAQDSAVKIRALIQRAEKITDIIALEREYESRDADIQSMASQLAALKDRADRSTVTLSIGRATEKPKPPAKPKKRQTGFVGGLKSGWDAFSATTVVLATAAGALLPFLVVVAIGLIGWWIVRRRRGAFVSSASETATPYATPAA